MRALVAGIHAFPSDGGSKVGDDRDKPGPDVSGKGWTHGPPFQLKLEYNLWLMIY